MEAEHDDLQPAGREIDVVLVVVPVEVQIAALKGVELTEPWERGVRIRHEQLPIAGGRLPVEIQVGGGPRHWSRTQRDVQLIELVKVLHSPHANQVVARRR